MRTSALVLALIALLLAALWTRGQFHGDLVRATRLAADSSRVVQTRCGQIEVQEAGAGVPLLMVHGSGGGHDQGMAWAKPLAQHGVRVIAVSRFGYLRTPRPADASPEAQADAHVCLLDALGVPQAVVVGVSAGAPSALQTAIRHPERVRALVLAVPIVFKPGHLTGSVPPVSDTKDTLLLRLLGSDFLFWAGLRLAPDQMTRHVLATPPDLVAAASEPERQRIHDLAERILPVSLRAAGLLDDTRLGKRLLPYALEKVRAPTLVVSARDDGFGTYVPAEYTARQISGSKFLGFERGGHLLVGHDETVRTAILELISATR